MLFLYPHRNPTSTVIAEPVIGTRLLLAHSFDPFHDELNLCWVESSDPRSRLSTLLSKVIIRPSALIIEPRLRSWRAEDAGSDAVDRPINHPFAPENGHNDYASYGTRRMDSTAHAVVTNCDLVAKGTSSPLGRQVPSLPLDPGRIDYQRQEKEK
jgi:hypothetical protein